MQVQELKSEQGISLQFESQNEFNNLINIVENYNKYLADRLIKFVGSKYIKEPYVLSTVVWHQNVPDFIKCLTDEISRLKTDITLDVKGLQSDKKEGDNIEARHTIIAGIDADALFLLGLTCAYLLKNRELLTDKENEEIDQYKAYVIQTDDADYDNELINEYLIRATAIKKRVQN